MKEKDATISKPLTRNQMQNGLMVGLYQYLFYVNMNEKPDIVKIIEEVFDAKIKEVDPFIRKFFKEAVVNSQQSIIEIEKHLKDWRFARLSLIEQAILLLGYTEIKYLEFPKPIAINIAVKLASKYADEKSTKFINAVLQRI